MNQLQTVQSLLLTFLGQVPYLANNQMFILIKEYNNSLQHLNLGIDKHLLWNQRQAYCLMGDICNLRLCPFHRALPTQVKGTLTMCFFFQFFFFLSQVLDRVVAVALRWRNMPEENDCLAFILAFSQLRMECPFRLQMIFFFFLSWRVYLGFFPTHCYLISEVHPSCSPSPTWFCFDP